MIPRTFRRIEDQLDRLGYLTGRDHVVSDSGQADVITSEVVDILNKERMHAPVLDIDFNATLIPSTTPGKYHLYLDKLVPHDKYMKLLKALAKAGIIEEGYAEASRHRGYSAVRLPWVRKPVTAPDPF